MFFGRLKLYLLGALALIAAFLGVYTKGRSDQKQKEKMKDLESFKKTTEDLNNVEDITSVDDADKFLHNRGKSRGILREHKD